MRIRDNYTTLTWTAGTVALERMNRARDAIAHVRQICPRRPLAAGREQGLVLGRPGLVAIGRSRCAPGPISSRPRPRPSCSTANWRSSGSAASSPPRPERRRCWSTDAQRQAYSPEAAGPGGSAARPAGTPRGTNPVHPGFVGRHRQSDADRLLVGRTGVADLPPGPGGVDGPVGAQFGRGFLLQGRLPDPSGQRALRPCHGRWSMASPARN